MEEGGRVLCVRCVEIVVRRKRRGEKKGGWEGEVFIE